ncbi:MAG: hypothetical protein JW860_06270 [Sedimentisphaerales bacterium]|nr:hypothetical protein [Sedimentisphaerales bacterium]
MIEIVTNKKNAMRISDLLHRQGGSADKALRNRCEKEKMTRLDVILQWGDPRKWQE